jgi:hypothetical protein
MIGEAWRRAWPSVIRFFPFPPEIRREIHATNALESVQARTRKVVTTSGDFPNDDAAMKLIWLALRNITADWRRPCALAPSDEPVSDPVRTSIYESAGLKVTYTVAAGEARPAATAAKNASHTKFGTLPQR